MMQFLKENFQLVCLLVGVVGVVISVITLAAEARKKRNDLGPGVEAFSTERDAALPPFTDQAHQTRKGRRPSNRASAE